MKKILLLSAILFASTCSVFGYTQEEISECYQTLQYISTIQAIEGQKLGESIIAELQKKVADPSHLFQVVLLKGYIENLLLTRGLTDADGNLTQLTIDVIQTYWPSNKPQEKA
jgi:hypothetical protein